MTRKRNDRAFRLLRRHALLSLGAACVAPWLGAAEPSSALHLRAQPAAADVWFAQGEAATGSAANRNFISNAGFVITGDGVVVVDALGSPTLARELIDEIRRRTDEPIRYLIVTHYHADHIYGLQAFKATGATILAHAEGREYLTSETARRRLESSRQNLFPWIDETTKLVPADRWLDRQETTLRVGSFDFLLRHVGPAHTAEDLAVLVPARKLVFTGDLVFHGRIPFVGKAGSERWIASLETLIDFGPDVLIPGHGPISTDPLADLALTRDYLQYLRQAMAGSAANLEPFEEAYAKADWSRFEHMPLFQAANRRNAYNTYLSMQQKGLR